MRGGSKPPVVETMSKAEEAAGADVVPTTTFVEKVPVLALIGASALSSASLTAMPVVTRFRAGKADVVPPNCSRLKSPVASL